MDPSLITTISALGGASIGGALSFLGVWAAKRKEVRAQWFVQDRLRRQDLYKEFIQVASKCFVDALQREKPDVVSLVEMYEKISRMRMLSSPQVISDADQLLRRIVEALSEPPITLTHDKVREMIESGSADVLRKFAESCRAEFDALAAQHF